MYMYLLLISYLLVFSIKLKFVLSDSSLMLAENLFVNLYSDPFLENAEFSEDSKMYIDDKVNTFLYLMKEREGTKHSLQRRSINVTTEEEVRDVYTLEGFKPLSVIHNSSYIDATIFSDNNASYIASLEETERGTIKLGLYKYNTVSFQQIFEAPASFAHKVQAIANENGIFVVAIEKFKIHIYQIKEEIIRKIQTLEISAVSDIYLWDNMYGFFMAAARNNRHSGTSHIYKWFGKHFDLVDTIESSGATSITAFTIGSSEFIAVANSEDEYGQKELFSTIFKYNVDTEKYEINQKIATNGAKKLAFLNFFQNGIKENFLVVINSNKEGKTYHTCIIYKFIDNYFMPYEGLTLDKPEDIVIIRVPNKQQLLGILSQTSGLKIYSYDGWVFNEVDLTPDVKIFISSISSIKTSQLSNRDVILVQKGNKANLFEITFTKKDLSKSMEGDIMKWCQTSLKNLQSGNNSQRETIIETTTPSGVIGHNKLEAIRSRESQIGDEFAIDMSNEIEGVKILDMELRQELQTLREIDQVISNSFTSTPEEIIFNHGLLFDELTINSATTLDKLYVNKINSLPVDQILRSKIDVQSLNEVEIFHFEYVSINKFPKLLNGFDTNLLLNFDNMVNLKEIIVEGNVTVEYNTLISGYLNDVQVLESNIFINGINQTFNNTFQTNNIEGNIITISASINNKTCTDINFIEIRRLESLSIQSLNVTNSINNVQLPVLNKLALKLVGNQRLEETIIFDTLITNEINTNGSHPGLLDGAVLVSNGTFNLTCTSSFNTLEVNELHISSNMNNIGVKNGVLDVLRRKADVPQEIIGNKTFERVNVLIPLTTKNGNNPKTRPIALEKEEVVTNGVSVEGTIFVKNILNAENIKSSRFIFGLMDIDKEALKLNNEEISRSLIFETIVVDNINTSNVNNIPLNELAARNDGSQLLIGTKTINSDIYINGYTKILRINDIFLQDFEDKVLKMNGEQTLIGKYYLNRIAADSISCMNTNLGNSTWEDISKAVLEISGPMNVEFLEIKKSNIHNLKLSKINTVNLEDVLKYAVKNETQLHGNKTLRKVYAKNVHSNNEFNMDDVPHIINSFQTNFYIEDNLQLREISIQNIHGKGFINGIESVKIRRDWTDDVVDHELDTDHIFHKVTILGKTRIQKNSINDLSLEDLFESTVKTDENHEFGDMTFDEFLIVFEKITLLGDLVGLDLDTAVAFNNNETQIISGYKAFEKMLSINGSLEITQKINGMKMKSICELLSQDKLFNLKINGNAIFTRGPEVDAVDGTSITKFVSNTWLKNREVNLSGYFKFQNITFQGEVNIEGVIDDIDLEDLVINYFSKSKNQTIFSHLDFTENVNFFSGLKSDEMLLDDSISGIRLKIIIGTALLDGYTQIFDDILYADNITVQNVNGEYLLNNLDVQRQAMRYDSENIVFGEINIFNLTIHNLITSDTLLIQNVNITRWLQQAVLKNGGSLKHCNFHNDVHFFKELGVAGYVNGKKFNNDTVLLKSALQFIQGTLLMHATNTTPVYFQNLKITFLNDIDLDEFIRQMVASNKDVKIKSPLNIFSPISTNNIEIKQLYNGVNITKLLNNLTSFDFSNFYENYSQLLSTSKQIKHSLDSYSKFLSHYELIQELSNVIYGDIFNNHLIAISFDNSRYYYQLHMWNSVTKRFRLIHESVVPSLQDITFIGRIEVDSKSYMYIEDTHYGYITAFSQESFSEFTQKLVLNKTISLHSFQITEKNLYCVIFITSHNSNTQKVYCKANEREIFTLMQTFVMPMSEASSLTMNGETFLITSTQQGNENFITIWQYHKRFETFTEIQHIYVASPCSISTISFKHSHYLAIASGNIEDAIYSGSVQIKWFHPTLETFVSYQAINVDSPKQIEFAILPSNELMLYVLTNSVSESFLVYEHEGIFGFNLKSNIKINTNVIKFANMNKEHLILASGLHRLKVIRAFFKSQMDG